MVAKHPYLAERTDKRQAMTATRIQTIKATADTIQLIFDTQVPADAEVKVFAFSPILAEECIEEYLTFDTNGLTGEHFALRVRGESMLEAGILPDDLVIVHQQEAVRNNDIVVALFEDEATVKRLSRKNGQIWLLPENDAYSPIDGTHAEMIGLVKAVIREY